ncbi:MAG: 30S ribosomal protein S12 methylthiotransferase RimO [Lachnospiraceae bacterium]|nr:30S ribosomal protein S12 methylthiotransferase RimO [Lachnospiraceae bacterium]
MKLFFVSLGCDKNLVDSEKMLALLTAHEITVTEDVREAEIIIVNTCSFIHDAKQESIETILEMAQMKEEGNCLALIVTGCLAQRYAGEIREEIPEVDAVVGTTAYDAIWEAVEKCLEGEKPCLMRDIQYMPEGLTERVAASTGHTAYLKIAEGCNKRCTYCIIPALRGNYRSVPMEELLEEAAQLARRGAKELLIIAQETTVYGMDLYQEKKLPELLKKLCEIPGIEWIRLLYCYPEEITEELLVTIKQEHKICHYLDLPIQHCCDDILKRMGRKTTKTDLIEKISMIREILPDVALRTTLISGFPGETEKQHKECVEFVADMKFDRLGVFPYSPEEGTPAAEYDGQIPEETKRQWADELMEAEQEVIFRQNEGCIGRRLSVIVDGYLPEEEVYVARSYRDAPDIDGCVFFPAAYEILSGTVLSVQVTDARGYDLIGEICSEEEE